MKLRMIILLTALAMAGPRPGEAAPQETINVEAAILCPVIVYVSAKTAVKPPLLIVLHGRGDTATAMAGIWNALKDPKPLLAVPEAPYPILMTGDKGNSLGGSWDSLTYDRALWEQVAAKTTKYIVDTIHMLQKKYETGGVYIMGHSQGVTFAYRVALQEPGLVRGVIAMAGYLEQELYPEEAFARASGKVDVFIGHGKQDEGVDPEVSRRARTFLAERGFHVVLDEFEGGHNLTWDVARRAQDWMMALEQKGVGR
jgi:phospholipase/carboxylesterase